MRYYRFRWEDPESTDHYEQWGHCTDFWEVGDDVYCVRSVQVYDNGQVLWYDEEHAADQYGILPEGPMDFTNADPEIPLPEEIDGEEFERVWRQGMAVNREA